MTKYLVMGTLGENGARHTAEAETMGMAEIIKDAMYDSEYEDLEIAEK